MVFTGENWAKNPWARREMRKEVRMIRGIFRRDFFVVRRKRGRAKRKEKIAPREKVRKRVARMEVENKRERFVVRDFSERRAGARRRLPMN